MATTPGAPLKPGATIGIIGGGQLGRMLAMAAARLGYHTVILEPQADCPAAQVANAQVTAAYDDPDALAEFAALCDVVTYEFENVPVEAARALAKTLPVLPPPAALEKAQDRLAEKTFLNDCGIETAPFIAVNDQAELELALADMGGTGVLKTRRLGYDGKGQQVFACSQDNPAGAFAALGSVPMILEGLVAFEKEISIIAARGRDGSFTAYDTAHNEHREGILHRSTVPSGVSAAVIGSARTAARALLDRLDYVGVVGIEFFVLADGSLLANEYAPRVHNSGHWTEAACTVSQFEQHIRAIAGLPLADGTRHSDCEMLNLIGNDVDALPAYLGEPATCVHLYGKAETRPGRKMGHVTRIMEKG